VQRWIFGPRPEGSPALSDLGPAEAIPAIGLLAASLVFGFHPAPVSSQAGAAAAVLAQPARACRDQSRPPPVPAAAPAQRPRSATAPSPATSQVRLQAP
jgi:hypothetical protein